VLAPTNVVFVNDAAEAASAGVKASDRAIRAIDTVLMPD
jgi:hypothetical protein